MDNYSTDRLPYNMLFPETFAFPLIRESGLPKEFQGVQNERALTSEALAEEVRAAGITRVVAMASVTEGIEAATAWAEECQGTVLICGSLFLVGEVLALRGEGSGAIDPSEAVRSEER